MVVTMVLLVISGVVIWRPYFAEAFHINAIRIAAVVHAVSAFILILGIIVHIYAGVFWVDGSLRAMTRGTVSHAWARHHHRAVASKESAAAASRLPSSKSGRSDPAAFASNSGFALWQPPSSPTAVSIACARRRAWCCPHDRLFAERAARFASVAAGNAMSGYLQLMAKVALAQQVGSCKPHGRCGA